MANADHVKWLLQGVDVWNAKRQNERFRPDLEGANVYAEFQNASKLKPDGKIPLDGIDLSEANLYRIDLKNASLEDAKLWGSDIRSANLSEANLTGADISDSALEGTNLWKCCLAGARLWYVMAKRAYLHEADLTNASLIRVDLEHADLAKTDLANCTLHQCNLDHADLTNATLTCAFVSNDTTMNNTILVESEPARAYLLGSPTIVEQYEYECSTGESIEQLIKTVRKIKSLYSKWSGGIHLYFRGEPRDDWNLSPSMMRKVLRPNVKEPFAGETQSADFDPDALHDHAHYLKELVRGFDFEGLPDAPRKYEGDMLLDLMSRRPHDFSDARTALAQWSLAQHHGLNTRLLDVTRNMLVALFFACEKYPRHDGRIHVFLVPTALIKSYNSDTLSIIANFAKLDALSQQVLLGNRSQSPDTCIVRQDGHSIAMRKLYHLIREEKPHFAERIDPRDLFRVLVVEPQRTSERIQAQSGAFMVSAFHERFERSEIQQASGSTPVYAHYEIEVPAGEAKSGIIEDLQMMGITRETLYPGLDSSAKVVNDMYRQRQQ